MTDLHDLSIADISRAISGRTLSPVELVDALIRRVEQLDTQQAGIVVVLRSTSFMEGPRPGRNSHRPE